MELVSSMKMAVGSIFSNKLRTFLTMLGVIIGVASVIVAVGFAKGSTSSITSSIEGTGTNLITINLMGRRTSSIKYDDVAEKLDYIDKNYLSEFDGIEVDSKIERQEAFKEPKEIIDALMTSQPFCEFEGLKEKLYKHYEIKK